MLKEIAAHAQRMVPVLEQIDTKGMAQNGAPDTYIAQINESVAGLDSLPEAELAELVSGAIQACGFTDPVEVRSVVATVLRAIEAPGAPRLYAF